MGGEQLSEKKNKIKINHSKTSCEDKQSDKDRVDLIQLWNDKNFLIMAMVKTFLASEAIVSSKWESVSQLDTISEVSI